MEAKTFVETVFSPGSWIVGSTDDAATATMDLEILRANSLEILRESESQGELKGRDEQLRQVARQLRYSIATREPLAAKAESKLKVTTVWGAKGLTAHHVYVLGLCREAIPGIRSAEYPGTDSDYYEEQRRLFYVTITRSRETLVLSRPKRIRPGDAQRLNLRVGPPAPYYSDLQMCPFLRDIMQTLPTTMEGEALLKVKPPFLLRSL
jgi:superfamily I DNA/RNA helicase